MSAFLPPLGLANPHIQTLLPRLFRRRPLFEPIWQTLETPDNDFLDLVWSEPPEQVGHNNKPIFVLFHGLEGSFYSPYANGLMHAFAQQGWNSVLMHFRGCSGRPNRLARAYHSGETSDARLVLEHIRQTYPNRTVIAAGVSLGGNMLVNYLSDYADDPIVQAATVISAPLDLASCSDRIEVGFSKVYRNYLMNSLKRNALLKISLLNEQLGIKAEQITNLHRLRDFDDLITAPLHGFADAQDYYQRCSGLSKLTHISIPTLLLQAKDDPFMTDKVVPAFTLPEYVHYRLLEHGGHVGFVNGSLLKPQCWLEQTLPKHYQYLLSND